MPNFASTYKVDPEVARQLRVYGAISGKKLYQVVNDALREYFQGRDMSAEMKVS
jgi:hypothetical protein